MKYADGAAFRRALEDRLRAQGLATSTPLVRLRKMVAFDRFLARLLVDQPNTWVLKGGLALQLRLGTRARTTKDVDLELTTAPADVHQGLVHAALLNLDDWFQFHVAGQIRGAGMRFPVRAELDGRPFETFHVDIGVGDPQIEPADVLATPTLLDFADIPPTRVPCYPLTQQIAEKVHAYTRPHVSGDVTRVKDWVDLLLIAGLGTLDARTLARAVQATFEARQTHSLPVRLPSPPAKWATPFRHLASEVNLEFHTLAQAERALAQFLDPVLASQLTGTWDPLTWAWR
jgi:hypothetical protein